jgi:hypothetical protein
MSRKKAIYLAMVVGSIFGGYIATLLGANSISWGSFLGSALGGFAGIYLGFKISG